MWKNMLCTHTHTHTNFWPYMPTIIAAICLRECWTRMDRSAQFFHKTFGQNVLIMGVSRPGWRTDWKSHRFDIWSQCCWWRFKLLKYNVAASISRVQGVHPSWACSKSEDGGSISKNAGIYLPIYTLWYPRRPESILPQISWTSRKCINDDIMVQNNMQNGNFDKQLYSQLLLIYTSLSSVLINKVILRYYWLE